MHEIFDLSHCDMSDIASKMTVVLKEKYTSLDQTVLNTSKCTITLHLLSPLAI